MTTPLHTAVQEPEQLEWLLGASNAFRPRVQRLLSQSTAVQGRIRSPERAKRPLPYRQRRCNAKVGLDGAGTDDDG